MGSIIIPSKLTFKTNLIYDMLNPAPPPSFYGPWTLFLIISIRTTSVILFNCCFEVEMHLPKSLPRIFIYFYSFIKWYHRQCSFVFGLEIMLAIIILPINTFQNFTRVTYSRFHKTLPKFSLHMHWIWVRFYEMGITKALSNTHFRILFWLL